MSHSKVSHDRLVNPRRKVRTTRWPGPTRWPSPLCGIRAPQSSGALPFGEAALPRSSAGLRGSTAGRLCSSAAPQTGSALPADQHCYRRGTVRLNSFHGGVSLLGVQRACYAPLVTEPTTCLVIRFHRVTDPPSQRTLDTRLRPSARSLAVRRSDQSNRELKVSMCSHSSTQPNTDHIRCALLFD